MKKLAIIFVSVLICIVLLAGCGNENSSSDNVGAKSVEIDDSALEPDGNVSSDVGSEGGVTYTLKDPDNADGIVITPKE